MSFLIILGIVLVILAIIALLVAAVKAFVFLLPAGLVIAGILWLIYYFNRDKFRINIDNVYPNAHREKEENQSANMRVT